jgi:hypothetical protein
MPDMGNISEFALEHVFLDNGTRIYIYASRLTMPSWEIQLNLIPIVLLLCVKSGLLLVHIIT